MLQGPMAGRPHLTERPVNELRPHDRNPRTHSKKQIEQLVKSIGQFGFINPVLIDDEDRIIAGHGRVEAAKTIGMETVPTLLIGHMSEADRPALTSLPTIALPSLPDGMRICSRSRWAQFSRLIQTLTFRSPASMAVHLKQC